MIYTNREQLTILEIDKGERYVSVERIKRILVEAPSNMIYCEQNGKLLGIISTGDIWRACRTQQNKVILNNKYKKLYFGEYVKAKEVFKENERINALPVVTKDNVLIGDYTRWDDLLILKYLINAGQNAKVWAQNKKIVLVRPGKANVDRQNALELFRKYLEVQNISVRCIEHSEVLRYLDCSDFILFVDENEVRAQRTVLNIIDAEKHAGCEKLKTYKDILKTDINFSNEQCSHYIKRLQDKGIKVFGLVFNESDYYKKLVKGIEDKFAAAGEELQNKPLYTMYKDFFDDLYSEDYAEKILDVPLGFENNGGVLSLKDHRSRYYNVIGGERSTTDQPDKYTRTIYFYGPCYIRGHYVEDKNTIESILQRYICNNGFAVRVVNCASIGMESNNLFLPRLAATPLKKGDIIVVGELPEDIEGVDYLDLSLVLEENNVGAEWLVDRVRHCNHKVNEGYAVAIYDMLKPTLMEEVDRQDKLLEKDEDFIKLLYLDKYFADFMPSKYQKIGAVVMNCNPFTYGHRYLVEQALRAVDFLILFVVEENRSVFSFAERYAMVCAGVEDLENIMVVPSGPFFASQMTIPEYFNNKQMTEDAEEHDEQDATIFAEKIALPLGIRYRFFGEEPFDIVTNQYNLSMKKILPLYGIEAVVIPRKTVEGEVVSASTVRKCLGGEDVEMLNRLLPRTTRRILGLA